MPFFRRSVRWLLLARLENGMRGLYAKTSVSGGRTPCPRRRKQDVGSFEMWHGLEQGDCSTLGVSPPFMIDLGASWVEDTKLKWLRTRF